MYENGTKKNARARTHNEIVSRLRECGRHPRECTAIYLPGPHDLDRKEFLRRGFLPENLCAVDKDPSCVRAVRANGGLGICGEVDLVVAGRPFNEPADVLFLDAWIVTTSMASAVLHGVLMGSRVNPRRTVLATNFQRGGRGGDGYKLKGSPWADMHDEERMPGHKLARNAPLLVGVFQVADGRHGPLPDYCFESFDRSLRTATAFHYKSKDGGTYFDTMITSHWPAIAADKFNLPSEVVRKVAAFRALRTVRLRRRTN